MEARKEHQRQMAGVSVGSMLYPSSGMREDIKRAGGKPKNHAKDNLKRIKELQAKNQLKKEAAAKPPPAPFKLKQFDDVASRVDTQTPLSVSTAASSDKDENSRPESKVSLYSAISGLLLAPSTTSTSMTKKKRNYIAENAARMRAASPKVVISPEIPGQRKTKVGQVPQYLVNRKMEWAQKEEERLQALQPDRIPEGMMEIPEADRLQTLEDLKKNREMLLDGLSKFPVLIETHSMKARQSALETRLQETEDAIALFSRSRILVKIDEYVPPTTGM